jgi:CRP-like cAMP-binding protein
MITVDELIVLNPFLDVPLGVVATLAKRAMERRFATDAVLFRAGSEPRGWYVVIHGKVRVIRSSNSRQHVIHTEGPGGTLGEVPLFAGGTHPATAIAAEPTRCALFSGAALEAAIAENHAVAFILLRRLSLRVRGLVNRLDERSSRSVQARLVEFLLTRPRSDRTSVVSVGMTQKALAEELGTVREVVARELRVLCRAGLLEPLGGGRYRLLDVARLSLPDD